MVIVGERERVVQGDADRVLKAEGGTVILGERVVQGDGDRVVRKEAAIVVLGERVLVRVIVRLVLLEKVGDLVIVGERERVVQGDAERV